MDKHAGHGSYTLAWTADYSQKDIENMGQYQATDFAHGFFI